VDRRGQEIKKTGSLGIQSTDLTILHLVRVTLSGLGHPFPIRLTLPLLFRCLALRQRSVRRRWISIRPIRNRPPFAIRAWEDDLINVTDVGEKIMNAPIMLSIKDFLAVSPEMSGYIHEQTRRKRIPVDTEATASTTELGATEQATTAVGNSYKLYYAISSGRAPVAINDKVCIQCLLDDGSELNIMSEDLYNELGHLIDRNIRRRINGFDSRIE